MTEHKPERAEFIEPELSDERTAQIRVVIMHEASRTPEATSRSARTRPALVAIGVGAAVVLAAGGAAAWVAATKPPDDKSGYCSASSTTDPQVWERHGFASAQDPNGTASPVNAVETCAAMWRAGIVSSPTIDPAIGVPPLTACVIDGVLVVYPEPAGVCGRLGLPAAITG